MPEALDIYRREKLNNRLLFNCDEFWITQNYVKLLDSFFNAMWIEFIKNNMDFAAFVGFDDAVHQVEELDAPTAFVMAARDHACGNIKGGKQGRRALALV